jgi:hypothetical protein
MESRPPPLLIPEENKHYTKKEQVSVEEMFGLASFPNTPTSRLGATAGDIRDAARNIARTKVRCENPKSVMIVTKIHDSELIHLTKEMACWIINHLRTSQGNPLMVYLDYKLKRNEFFNYPGLKNESTLYSSQIRFWTTSMCRESPDLFDFVITLGGDGTVLYTSWLFQKLVPPIIPFHLGSLGFLTVFAFQNYKAILNHVVTHGVRVNLRMRFACTVFRARDSDGKPISCGLARRRSASLYSMCQPEPAVKSPIPSISEESLNDPKPEMSMLIYEYEGEIIFFPFYIRIF